MKGSTEPEAATHRRWSTFLFDHGFGYYSIFKPSSVVYSKTLREPSR